MQTLPGKQKDDNIKSCLLSIKIFSLARLETSFPECFCMHVEKKTSFPVVTSNIPEFWIQTGIRPAVYYSGGANLISAHTKWEKREQKRTLPETQAVVDW